MPLRRKQRRKGEQRRHHESQPKHYWGSGTDVREVDDARPSPDWALLAPGELEGVYGTAPWASTEDPRDIHEPPTVCSSSRSLQEAREVERLAYTRRQAAEALGVSISTIDRRVVPSISTVKTPWGQRLIPVDEIERFMRNHLIPAGRPAGRPPTLPRSVVERIRLEYARGRGLAEIARMLTTEGIPTAHGGRRWWPSTVRTVLVRSSPLESV
jgi:Recombinase